MHQTEPSADQSLVKNQGKRVHFEVVSFVDKLTFARGDKTSQLQSYAQQFADALEAQCAKAPYQWFNFYPFWHQ